MRCASLSIGIANYRDVAFRSSETRLQFARADASAFHRYAALAWPGSQDGHFHLELLDEAATLARASDAFDRFRSAGRFDQVLIYLSGHGQRVGDAAWFCTWDAVEDSPSLTSAGLDALVRKLNARVVLLVLDCCHAEAVTAGMQFFSTLGGEHARLFCASSRADEMAWEDTHLSRSILSHVLFEALSQTSRLADPTGHVDVTARLLPYLREQVPLVAARAKRGVVQQPVIGGVAASEVQLPTVMAESIGRPLTLRETLQHQMRRIALVAVTSVVVVLLLAELLVTHLAVAGDQTILMRPGTASTYSMVPIHWAAHVDTGFRVSDLITTDRQALNALASGELRSIATQRTRDGLRPWIEQLEPLIKVRSSLDFIREQGPDSEEVLGTTFTAINFAARTTGSKPHDFAAQREVLARAPLLHVACDSVGHAQIMDFEVASSGSAVNFIRGFVRYGAVHSKDPSAEIWKLSRFIGDRALRRNYDPEALEEIHVLLEEVSRMHRELAMSPDTRGAVQAVSPPADPNSCSMLALALAIALGPEDDKARAEALLLANQRSGDGVAALMVALRNSGAPWETLLSLPRQILTTIGTHRPLQGETLRELGELLIGDLDDDELEEFAELVEFPTSIYDRLLKILNDSSNPQRQGRAFRRLARAYLWMKPTQQATLNRWADEDANVEPLVSDGKLARALLSRYSPIRPAVAQAWTDQLSSGVARDPQTDFDKYHLIIADAREEVAALAISAYQRPLAPTTADQVYELLATRSVVPLRRDALASLANSLRASDAPLSSAILSSLLEHRGSASRRTLAIDIAVAALNQLPNDQSSGVVRDLAAHWRSEHEPELRRAIGMIISRAD